MDLSRGQKNKADEPTEPGTHESRALEGAWPFLYSPHPPLLLSWGADGGGLLGRTPHGFPVVRSEIAPRLCDW
jgi:hypothetical protein